MCLRPATARGRTGCPASTSCRTASRRAAPGSTRPARRKRRRCIVTNQTITLPQGNTTLRVREFGDTRLPTVAGLDLSFRKTFRAGNRTLAPRIDIFNATNESTVTRPHHAARPDVRPDQRHPARAVDQSRVERRVLTTGADRIIDRANVELQRPQDIRAALS